MAVHHNRPHDDSVLEAERVDAKPPPMYRVLLLNDDYTPMDFVVGVLQQVFAMTRNRRRTSCCRCIVRAWAPVACLREKLRTQSGSGWSTSRRNTSIRFSVRWSLNSLRSSGIRPWHATRRVIPQLLLWCSRGPSRRSAGSEGSSQ